MKPYSPASTARCPSILDCAPLGACVTRSLFGETRPRRRARAYWDVRFVCAPRLAHLCVFALSRYRDALPMRPLKSRYPFRHPLLSLTCPR